MKFIIVLLLLCSNAQAAQTHVYGYVDNLSSIYVHHDELPEWAAEGSGPLWHWQGVDGRWWQIRGDKSKYLAVRYPVRKVRRQCFR